MIRSSSLACIDDSFLMASEGALRKSPALLLIEAAGRLLSLMIALRSSEPNTTLESLHVKIVQEVRVFEYKAQVLGFSMDTILAARYCLCTTIDEIILTTSWGSKGIWGQHSLLSFFHKETLGGEKFYIILEKMAEREKQNFPLLVLMYVLMSLGFEGKYYDKGKIVLEAIRYSIYQKVRCFLPDTEDSSFNIINIQKRHIKVKRRIPIWPLVTIIGSVIIIAALLFKYDIYKLETPVFEILNSIPAHP